MARWFFLIFLYSLIRTGIVFDAFFKKKYLILQEINQNKCSYIILISCAKFMSEKIFIVIAIVVKLIAKNAPNQSKKGNLWSLFSPAPNSEFFDAGRHPRKEKKRGY